MDIGWVSFRACFVSRSLFFDIVRSTPWPSRVPPRERHKASVAFPPHLEIAA
jgi:hypothetical protein